MTVEHRETLGHQKVESLNSISVFQAVGVVRGHLRNSHVEFVSFGDLMEDRRHTTVSFFVYTSQLWGCI